MSKKENTKKNSKTKVTKKDIKEEIKTNDKIKEIKKKTKKQKMPKEHKRDFNNMVVTLDEKRKTIYAFAGGLLLGLLIMVLFTPKRIATLKDGSQPIAKLDGKNITSTELYTMMKDHYSISLLLSSSILLFIVFIIFSFSFFSFNKSLFLFFISFNSLFNFSI